eukprot:scaffold334_cov241-Pinguiococcus_pyrenoidosus.AAC.78
MSPRLVSVGCIDGAATAWPGLSCGGRDSMLASTWLSAWMLSLTRATAVALTAPSASKRGRLACAVLCGDHERSTLIGAVEPVATSELYEAHQRVARLRRHAAAAAPGRGCFFVFTSSIRRVLRSQKLSRDVHAGAQLQAVLIAWPQRVRRKGQAGRVASEAIQDAQWRGRLGPAVSQLRRHEASDAGALQRHLELRVIGVKEYVTHQLVQLLGKGHEAVDLQRQTGVDGADGVG